MPLRKPLSFQQKITGIVFLVSMFVLVLTSSQFILFELKRIQDFAEDDLRSLAKVISANAALPMAIKDHVSMQEIMNSLGARQDISSAYLLRPNGTSIVSYYAGSVASVDVASLADISFLKMESRHIEEGRRLGEEKIWQEGGRLAHLMPVVYENSLVGYSYLSFEMGPLRQEKLYLAIGWLVSVGAAVLVTFLLSARMQKHITAPIEELAMRMKDITREKRLDGGAPHEGQDEFSLLFNGFDEMIKALKERDQLLEKHRRDLELEVQVRTRAMESEKEKAEQATLAKSIFLANMSHEIRTPMIGILGMAELLRMRPLDKQDLSLVETIYESGEALLAILNDVLDFTKIEAGQLNIDVVPVDLKHLTEDVVKLMAVNAYNKGLELKVEMPDMVPVVIGDPGRIRQILLNLVGNALKFTNEGEVSLSLLTTLDELTSLCHCLFVVKDTGVGIDPDVQERIFDSFDQADSSITRKYGGTGLGLAIVRNLVQLMGGSVNLESQPGQGSTFSVSLPLPLAAEEGSLLRPYGLKEEATGLTQPDHSQAAFGLNGTGKHILLAEDNPTTQKLIAILLEQNGFEFTVVDNGQAAISFLEKKTVDLVFMDCQMPEMDGFRATRHLRSAGVKVPIIALTAYARAEDEEQCLAAGMNDFLSKPFRQREMNAMLQKWLGASTRNMDRSA